MFEPCPPASWVNIGIKILLLVGFILLCLVRVKSVFFKSFILWTLVPLLVSESYGAIAYSPSVCYLYILEEDQIQRYLYNYVQNNSIIMWLIYYSWYYFHDQKAIQQVSMIFTNVSILILQIIPLLLAACVHQPVTKDSNLPIYLSYRLFNFSCCPAYVIIMGLADNASRYFEKEGREETRKIVSARIRLVVGYLPVFWLNIIWLYKSNDIVPIQSSFNQSPNLYTHTFLYRVYYLLACLCFHPNMLEVFLRKPEEEIMEAFLRQSDRCGKWLVDHPYIFSFSCGSNHRECQTVIANAAGKAGKIQNTGVELIEGDSASVKKVEEQLGKENLGFECQEICEIEGISVLTYNNLQAPQRIENILGEAKGKDEFRPIGLDEETPKKE